MIKKSLLISVLAFSLAFAAKADVAPEVGQTRVNLDLILETKEDLSNFDFELDFHGDKRKVVVNSNGRTVISASGYGGGARYGSANLYAIPKKTEANSSGQIKLLTHYFKLDMTIIERLTYSPAIYLIESDGTTLKATKSGGNYSYNFLLAVIFITLAIVFFGFLMFRKILKKPKINV